MLLHTLRLFLVCAFGMSGIALFAEQPQVPGERLFAQHCQTCHGPAGQGGRAPALNRATFTHGDSDLDIARTIRNGVLSTEMPPFADLSDDNIQQLVTYVQRLRPATRPPVTRLNDDTFSSQVRDASGRLHLIDKLTNADVVVPTPNVSFDRLANAAKEPHNWLMYWGDYQGTHYSPLQQIDASNV